MIKKLNAQFLWSGRLKLKNVSEMTPSSRKFSLGTKGDEQVESREALVLVEQFEKVTLMGLNRPEKRNALNSALITALRDVLSDFERNDTTAVGVIYGVGGNFCAGLDLEEISLPDHAVSSLPLVDELCTKPIVASISGYAVGEGFDLAMACDIRIVEETAILGSFNRRFGVPMSPTAVARLSSCVGLSNAMSMILTGRPILAKEAFEKGMCGPIVSCGAGRGDAFTVATSLGKFPQAALRADKAALYQTLIFPEKLANAISEERKSMLALAEKEFKSNTQKFSSGVGKHGTFKNVIKYADEWKPDWMKK